MADRTNCKAFETVQKEIFSMYSDHTLKPGDCVYETAIAEKLGLSRTPVRDALGRLVANGFLEQHQGKRGYMMPKLTSDDMHDAFEARECLDEKIGWLAAEKATSRDLRMLSEINERETRLLAEYKGMIDEMDYMQANNEFHLNLAHIAGNSFIERAYEPIYWRTQLYVYYLGPFIEEEKKLSKIDNNASDTPHEHAEIIEAIEKRDAAEAAKKCREHIHYTFTYRLSKQYDSRPELFERLLTVKGLNQ
jgi:DNA-binding GntR family transcriptional regulator